MKAIINTKLILSDRVTEGCAIVFDDKIRSVVKESEVPDGCEIIDAGGNFTAPGLVDIHIHGYLGCDVSDGDIDGLRTIAGGIIKNGVTSWCPTTMTVAMEQIEKAFDTARTLKNDKEYYGAEILGVNCEGPFINPSKKGAQAEEHIKKPDGEFIKRYSDIVKLFTVAPEMDGALECIRTVARDTDVLISMGHTGASFDEANAGIEAGVRHATHLFNAMTALMHRNPGVVGAALSSDEVSCELIADTFHVNPGLYKMVERLKGERLILITDCIRAGGLADGEYDLGGQNVTVRGIQCLLADGTIAGSVLKLNRAVYNLMKYAGLPVEKAFAAASANPAKAIGVADRKGSLEPGHDSDIIIVDSNFDIQKTILGGVIRYER